MGLFGKGKKDKADKNANPNATSAAKNPYAIQSSDDSYTGPAPNAYQQAKANYGASDAASVRSAAPSYQSQAPGYEPNTGYNSAGYGQNRYDSGNGMAPASSRGPAGYGGLGRTDSSDTTVAQKNALFGDAPQRMAAASTSQQRPAENSGYGASGDGGYGGGSYGQDRQLTEEEQEEEDVQATKQQIRFMKQEDVSSTRNALRIAQMAEETGRATLARLGAQGERIHNTEKNLDLAANHNRIAEERAKELKTLNKSMFAVHVSNPFTASSRRQQRDDDILEKHRAEKEQREETRKAGYEGEQRMEKNFRELSRGTAKPIGMTKQSLAERSKYQFEADSEDEEMENEIDNNLDALSGAAGRLNMLARATGEEVERQNVVLDRVARKTDKVDDQIVMNRARLDRIK